MTTKTLEALLISELGEEISPQNLALKLKVGKSTIYNLVNVNKLVKRDGKIQTRSLFNCLF